MAIDPVESMKPDTEEQQSSPIDLEQVRSRCLVELRKRIQEATDELVLGWGYKVIDAPPPRLRSDAAAGIVWGYTLPVERLEQLLGDLQFAVVEGSMTAQQAVEAAHERVMETVLELRPGARVRKVVFRTPTPLPPTAELGRACAIVSRLTDDLIALGERCGGSHPRPTTFNVHLRSVQ